MSVKPFTVGDILYTKDGRKSGNITCVHIQQHGEFQLVYFMSDYGNLVKFTEIWNDDWRSQQFRYFFIKRGTVNTTHKYYNYYNTHPEMFL